MSKIQPITRKPPLPPDPQQAFEDLCTWIKAHLHQPIGWQELMVHSKLDFRTINLLFFKYGSTTPMTWIRRLRQTES